MITLEQIVDQLVQEGVAPETAREQAAEILAAQQSDTPWFIQGLMGCGGYLAAMFLLSFFGGGLFFFNNEVGAVFSGAVLCGIVILIRRRMKTESTFLTQLLLTVALAGQLLVIFGIGSLTDVTVAAMATIALQVVFLFLYRDLTVRFLAVISIGVALLVLIFELEIPYAVTLLTLAFGVLTFYIWADLLPLETRIEYRELLRPVSYAAPIAMFGTIILELTEQQYSDFTLSEPIVTATGLLLLLMWLEFMLLERFGEAPTGRTGLIVFGSTLLLAVPVLRVPGIVAALLVMLLGFRRRNWLVIGTSGAFLAGFISYYYYDLETSLLYKSYLLFATGMMMLVIRYVFRRNFADLMEEQPA